MDTQIALQYRSPEIGKNFAAGQQDRMRRESHDMRQDNNALNQLYKKQQMEQSQQTHDLNTQKHQLALDEFEREQIQDYFKGTIGIKTPEQLAWYQQQKRAQNPELFDKLSGGKQMTFEELQQIQPMLQQQFGEKEKRATIKGADGYYYYEDDQTRVLPGVEKKESGSTGGLSKLGKIYAEMDKLPEDDPRREQYKAIIDKETGSGAASVYTPQQIQYAAQQYNLTGKMPTLGRGKTAGATRQAIHSASLIQNINAGKTPGDVQSLQHRNKALGQSLNQQEKQMGSMRSFVLNLGKQVDRVTELSGKFEMAGLRVLNLPLRAVRGRIAGHADQAIYEMYLTEIESEIGKLATGSTGSVAELSATAQEKWAKIHDKNLPMKDMLKLLQETKHAGELRMESVEEARDMTLGEIQALGTMGIVPQPTQQEQAPKEDDVMPGHSGNVSAMSDEEILQALGIQ